MQSIKNQIFNYVRAHDGKLDHINIANYFGASHRAAMNALNMLETEKKICRAQCWIGHVYEVV